MKRLAVFLAAMLPAAPAAAYMGPGAGLGMLGSLLAVAGAILLALAGLYTLSLHDALPI